MTSARRITSILVLAVISILPSPARSQPSQNTPAATIVLRLSNFSFTPDRLQLRVGVPVHLNFVNVSGGGHNFSAPEFFAASLIVSGLPPKDGTIEVASEASTDLTLIPRAAGTYEFRCRHFLHSVLGMSGTILVTAQ